MGLKARVRQLLLDVGRVLTVFVCKHLPVRKRVLFYTERAQDRLMDNLESVYSSFNGKKIICANSLPHPAVKKPLIYYYLYTSKVIVTDDYIRYLRVIKLRESQRVVQLWHGGGMFKKICLDAPLKMSREEERAAHSQYSALIVSSNACVPVYADAFGVSERIILPYGMPRTDRLVNPEEREKLCVEFYERYPHLKGRRIISYFPTFREKDGERIPLDPKLDWGVINSTLGENDVFLIHRHPVVHYELYSGGCDKIIDLTDCPSAMLFCVSSLIVTDYSSVVFDASLLDISFVFYCPDMESYDRDFYIDPEHDLPGKVTRNQPELIAAMCDALENPDLQVVRSFRDLHMGACDGNATKRAVDTVMLYYSERVL